MPAVHDTERIELLKSSVESIATTLRDLGGGLAAASNDLTQIGSSLFSVE